MQFDAMKHDDMLQKTDASHELQAISFSATSVADPICFLRQYRFTASRIFTTNPGYIHPM